MNKAVTPPRQTGIAGRKTAENRADEPLRRCGGPSGPTSKNFREHRFRPDSARNNAPLFPTRGAGAAARGAARPLELDLLFLAERRRLFKAPTRRWWIDTAVIGIATAAIAASAAPKPKPPLYTLRPGRTLFPKPTSRPIRVRQGRSAGGLLVVSSAAQASGANIIKRLCVSTMVKPWLSAPRSYSRWFSAGSLAHRIGSLTPLTPLSTSSETRRRRTRLARSFAWNLLPAAC